MKSSKNSGSNARATEQALWEQLISKSRQSKLKTGPGLGLQDLWAKLLFKSSKLKLEPGEKAALDFLSEHFYILKPLTISHKVYCLGFSQESKYVFEMLGIFRYLAFCFMDDGTGNAIVCSNKEKVSVPLPRTADQVRDLFSAAFGG